MKTLAAFLLTLLLFSCGALRPKTQFIRDSGLHHLSGYSTLERRGDSPKVHLVRRDAATGKKISDRTVIVETGTDFTQADSTDLRLYVIENGDVIWYSNSYWIKKGAYRKEYDKYCNQDIRF